MPKKIKLTPKQQEQEAAMHEVEAFFNAENEIEKQENENKNIKRGSEKSEKLVKKSRLIAVRKTEKNYSPYLVNLAAVENTGERDAPFAPKKIAPDYSVNILKSRKNFSFKEKYSQTGAVKKVKKLFSAADEKVNDFYHRHEEVLSELLAVNILMLMISVVKRLLKFLGKVFYAIIGLSYSVFVLSINLIFSFINSSVLAGKFIIYAAKTACVFLVKIFKNIFIKSAGGSYYYGAKLFKRIFFSVKRLIFYICYPFRAVYSNTKKFFRIGRNEIGAIFYETKSIGGSAASQLKKQTFSLTYGIKAKITDNAAKMADNIITKVAKIFEKIGRVFAGLADYFIILFKTAVYRIKLFFSFKFLPPIAWSKQLAVFILLGLVLIAPLKVFSYFNIFEGIKGQVLGESEEAISNLRQAADAGGNFNFLGAASHFSEAADNFNQAQSVLTDYSHLITIANIIPAKKAKLAATGRSLIISGKIASEIGGYLASAIGSLELNNPNSAAPLTERLKQFSYYNNLIKGKLDEFEKSINEVDEDVLTSLKINNQEQVITQLRLLKSQVEFFKKGINELAGLSDILPIFLGDRADKRYLLIFQNNAEMRGSGGFIGSYALVDFNRGKIKNIEVPTGGSYDLQGGLHKRIISPEPLHLISSLWEFQDSNWWPDWPTSSKKIQWFFENGWGSSVDGVIAIDTTLAERLLEIIGPIDMREKYGVIITSENFYDVVQAQAERKDTNTPKEIIADLADKLAAELPERINNDNFFNIIKEMEKLFLEKHILLNFNDPVLQDFVAKHNWEGEIKNTNSDYLSVVNTNIAGGKSDRKIGQGIEHTAEIMPDGSIIDTLVITRSHNGRKGEPFAGVRNVNYLRVYVPLGSQLLSASGFLEPDAIFFDEPAAGAELDPDIHFTENIAKVDEASGVKIYSEFNKTVFGNWTQVDPGKTITISLKYKLPFKINSIVENNNFFNTLLKGNEVISPYSLLVQKQAGSIETAFLGKLILPRNMRLAWSTDDGSSNEKGWEIKDNLTQDKIWGALIKKMK